MGTKLIRIRKANVNNLKDISLDIEYGKMVVLAGPSGSGKSSFAFDVLYAAAASQGSASGVLKFFRQGGGGFEVSGLPAKTVGIEQQIYSTGSVENIGHFTGYSFEVAEYFMKETNDGPEVCPDCQGNGHVKDIDPERVVKRGNSAVTKGAFTPGVKKIARLNIESWRAFCRTHKCDPETEWVKLDAALRMKVLFDGSRYFDGVVPALKRYVSQHNSNNAMRDIEEEISFYLSNQPCSRCQGRGIVGNWLKEGIRADLDSLMRMGAIMVDQDELRWIKMLRLEKLNLFYPVYKLCGSEIRNLRLYLSLRGLEKGSLVIVDEPTAGLLPSEAKRVIELLLSVKEKGHAVVVVEHRHELIGAADEVIAFGPGSGSDGGRIVFRGNPHEYLGKVKTSRKNYVRHWYPSVPKGTRRIRASVPKFLTGHFAEWHSFEDFEVRIPLEQWTCIAGPVGSGKTSYLEALYAMCDKTPVAWQGRSTLVNRRNHDSVRRPHVVSPDPIGQHPGSTPATFIGLWSKIRDLFAEVPEAKRRGFTKSHFSFNMKEGQCRVCGGYGFQDVKQGYVACPECNGTRYRPEILRCLYRGKSIAEVNDMDVRHALQFFKGIDSVHHYLACLSDLLLEYLVLGQPSNSLSGGESQRVKLAVELSKRYGSRTLYLLDNPCRGVGESVVSVMGEIFKRLTSRKNTIITAENTPEMAREADWLICLGERRGSRLTILYEGPGSGCPERFWRLDF